MITQIYETQSPQEATALIKAGVDHIGVLVGRGEFPREKSIEQTRDIFAVIKPPAKKIALPLTTDLAYIKKVIEQTAPDIVQIGALIDQISPEDVQMLKEAYPSTRMMRVIPVTGPESITQARAYDGIADWLLLDTLGQDGRIIGATGQTHDWQISKKIVEQVSIPVILAGGLGPENVAESIFTVHPQGVDCKTKTDKPGKSDKDLDLVKAFVIAAQQTAS